MQFHFEQLTVWQTAMELVEGVYRTTQAFPSHEQFGLTAQLRRAAASIPANIAEGEGRYHKKEFLQFLYNARGSLYEVMTLSVVGLKLQYLNQDQYQQMRETSQVIFSKLTGLINSLRL